MSKATTTVEDKKYLIEAILPEATPTYTVIPHELVINTATKLIEERGFTITKEIYKYNNAAQVACGIYHLSHCQDEDMGMLFTWTNSYDKTVRFKCFVGAYVIINGNVLISNSDGGVFKRKHTGEADTEVEATIFDQLNSSLLYYDELVRDKEIMKSKIITPEKFAEICGRLYMVDKMISSEQMGIIKKEFVKPSFKYDCGETCLWTFYNHILTGIIKCHPSKWVEQQRMIHIWMKNEFKIGSFIPVKPSSEHNERVPAIDIVQTFPQDKEIEDIAEEAIERFPETLSKLEDDAVEEIKQDTDMTLLQPSIDEVIEEHEEIIDTSIPTEFLDKLSTEQTTLPKTTVHSLLPNAEIGTLLVIDDIELVIVDENESDFILAPTELEEEKLEREAEEEIESHTTITLPPVQSKKLAPVTNFLKPEDIQILPPVERTVDPKITDAIRSKISQEIHNLYGTLSEFTFENVEGQYNVLLKSGESFTTILNKN